MAPERVIRFNSINVLREKSAQVKLNQGHNVANPSLNNNNKFMQTTYGGGAFF